jgi:hypothetical protein
MKSSGRVEPLGHVVERPVGAFRVRVVRDLRVAGMCWNWTRPCLCRAVGCRQYND